LPEELAAEGGAYAVKFPVLKTLILLPAPHFSNELPEQLIEH
jgi:hypothetical protein